MKLLAMLLALPFVRYHVNWVAFGTWVIVLHCAALALWLGSLALKGLGRAAPSTVAAVAFFVSVATDWS